MMADGAHSQCSFCKLKKICTTQTYAFSQTFIRSTSERWPTVVLSSLAVLQEVMFRLDGFLGSYYFWCLKFVASTTEARVSVAWASGQEPSYLLYWCLLPKHLYKSSCVVFPWRSVQNSVIRTVRWCAFHRHYDLLSLGGVVHSFHTVPVQSCFVSPRQVVDIYTKAKITSYLISLILDN